MSEPRKGPAHATWVPTRVLQAPGIIQTEGDPKSKPPLSWGLDASWCCLIQVVSLGIASSPHPFSLRQLENHVINLKYKSMSSLDGKDRGLARCWKRPPCWHRLVKTD